MAVAPIFSMVYRRYTTAGSMDGFLPRYTPLAFAAAMPSIWRSRLRLVSNSAKTPSISRKALPAAERVSHWLFCCPERYALLIQGIHNVLQVLNAAGQAIHACHHQRITRAQELQQQLQLAPSGPAASAGFFCTNNFTTSSAENLCLQSKILIAG